MIGGEDDVEEQQDLEDPGADEEAHDRNSIADDHRGDDGRDRDGWDGQEEPSTHAAGGCLTEPWQHERQERGNAGGWPPARYGVRFLAHAVHSTRHGDRRLRRGREPDGPGRSCGTDRRGLEGRWPVTVGQFGLLRPDAWPFPTPGEWLIVPTGGRFRE